MMGKEILRHELIGSHIRIVDAKNKSLIGLYGKIIDETKNMITIENKDIVKKLIKDQVVISIKHKGHLYEINGELLVNRPEDRIKRIRRLS